MAAELATLMGLAKRSDGETSQGAPESAGNLGVH